MAARASNHFSAKFSPDEIPFLSLAIFTGLLYTKTMIHHSVGEYRWIFTLSLGVSSKMRDFSRFSADCFNDDLSQADWNAILQNGANDANKLFSSFYNTFNKIVNKHAPMKTISHR